MLSLSELRNILFQTNFRPRKSLGQNFLIDRNIQQKILQTCQLSCDDIVLEIGPGLGALTGELCKRVKFVYAVEKDRVLCQLLRENLKNFENLEIINQDILKLRLPFTVYRLPSQHYKLKVMGNLPYYIVTPILAYLIENRRFIDSIYITLQKELAQRIIACPGGKQYGAFTVFVNYYTNPTILFPIKRGCFYPQPEVDSCFMKLEVLKGSRIQIKNEKLFFEIVRAAFQKRRKTIVNSLVQSRLNLSRENLISILGKAGIEPARRAETLSIEDFHRIYKKLLRLD